MDTADADVRRNAGDDDAEEWREPLMEPLAPEVADRLRAGPNQRARRRAMLLRVVRGVGWTSITLGLLILGFVAHQLWVTTYFAEQNQGDLAKEREKHFDSVEVEEVVYAPAETSGVGTPQLVIDPVTGEAKPPILLVETPPDPSEAFALLRIPSIERLQAGWNVVEGVRLSDLKNGAGHMPHTPLPGQPGNSVISGHRTTYGQPFHELDELEAGDLIYVDTAIGTHGYAVRDVFVVKPTELWVTEDKDGAWLTLTTCHPRFSAAERLIVQAQLVSGPNAAVILGTT